MRIGHSQLDPTTSLISHRCSEIYQILGLGLEGQQEWHQLNYMIAAVVQADVR
jgi:hypothetical protein